MSNEPLSMSMFANRADYDAAVRAKRRAEFEGWFTAHAMPCESDWFRRDGGFPTMYYSGDVDSAWSGWLGALGICREEYDDGEPSSGTPED